MAAKQGAERDGVTANAAPGLPDTPIRTDAPPAAAQRPPVPSEALFRGATELQIAHRGNLYRLKQTALGKLILTK